MRSLCDSSGKPCRIGVELGRGGEGAVHEFPVDPGVVAKIYLKPPDRAQAEKLKVMVGLADERLVRLAAWPLATLHDERGGVAGFTMPRVSGLRPVFQVYGPKLRLRHYPKADWRFLVRVAENTARAFDVIASYGHVVGDVNHGNLFVATDATVRMIDTDSFQVSHAGRTWPCTVGVGTHQPPEMQGLASYKDVVRTPNHDAFGLAVMAFQLLCMGWHPFMGRYNGPGEPPDIPTAIASSRYAQSRDHRRTQMSPGAGSLPVSVLPDEVQAMFEAAFSPASTRGGRPTAAQWAGALHRLGGSLSTCKANPGHSFPTKAGSCPWCAVEAVTGAPLFPVIFVAGREGAGIALLWQQVLSVGSPPVLRPLVEPNASGVSPSPDVVAERQASVQRRVLACVAAAAAGVAVLSFVHSATIPLLAIGMVVGWFWFRPAPVAALDAEDRLREARDGWRELDAEWRAYADPERFRLVRQQLGQFKLAHDALPEERKARLATLMANRRESQLHHHLEGFDLAGLRIPGIGKSKVATLISYGICSAADIRDERIEPIPGFGPKTIGNMIAAREACSRSFRFDAGRALSTAEVAGLDQDVARQRLGIERQIEAGLSKLKAIATEGASRSADLEYREAGQRRELAQAMADVAAAGRA
jgi:DNA-binding helix-hairpin-helix protein with protein kinase domain